MDIDQALPRIQRIIETKGYERFEIVDFQGDTAQVEAYRHANDPSGDTLTLELGWATPHPNSLKNVRDPLPEGIRSTKALRFTLPDKLADKLEAMSKPERDELMAAALKDR